MSQLVSADVARIRRLLEDVNKIPEAYGAFMLGFKSGYQAKTYPSPRGWEEHYSLGYTRGRTLTQARAA